MVLLTTDVLVADYLMKKEKLDYSNMNHILMACNMAILINNNTDFPLEGYGAYLKEVSKELDVDLIKAPIPRQMNDKVIEKLTNEIDSIEESYLDNWFSFCGFVSANCPTLWVDVYTYTLKDCTTPRDFIGVTKLRMKPKYCLPDITLSFATAELTRDYIVTQGNLNKVDPTLFTGKDRRFIFLNCLIDGLRAYNSVSAIEFEPVVLDRAVFIPKVLETISYI